MSKLKSLTDVPIGHAFVVSKIQGGSGVINRLKSLGIRPGTEVTKISGKNRGTVVIKHDRNQTALGFGVCQKIIVEVD